MRILAAVIAVALTFTNLTLARRSPGKDNSASLISVRYFRNPAYVIYSAAGFCIFLTMYAVCVAF